MLKIAQLQPPLGFGPPPPDLPDAAPNADQRGLPQVGNRESLARWSASVSYLLAASHASIDALTFSGSLAFSGSRMCRVFVGMW